MVGNGGPHTYGIVTDAPWCQMAEVLQDDALTRNRLALERHAHSLHLLRRKVFQDEMVLVRTPSPTLTLSHSTRWVFTVNQLTQPTDLPCPCPALAPHRKLEAVAVEDYQLAADLKRQIDGLWDAQRAAEML